jgi:hypothetical protein
MITTNYSCRICQGGELAMQVVYVLQISDDIDKPVAFATALHAKDRAAIVAHDRGITLAGGVLTNRVHRGVSFPIARSR